MANPLAPEHIRVFFSAEGPLAQTLAHYEEREEQIQVAQRVAESLDERSTLLAEAGTGTGKTLAYLVPALASGLKVVVSTGTKNLQEQLIYKDIPLLEEATGHKFPVHVMKGRSNYLCELRANQFMAQGVLPNTPLGRQKFQLETWRQETQTGDRAELTDLPEDASIWREVSCTSEQCLGRKCGDYEPCWVTQMRRAAQEAQIIIVNHHLFFADANLRLQSGRSHVDLIPEYDAVIFDEAHDLDDIASQHFGFECSDARIFMLCRDIAKSANQIQDLPKTLDHWITKLEISTRRLFSGLPFSRNRTTLDPKSLRPPIHAERERLERIARSLQADLRQSEAEEARHLSRRVGTMCSELSFVLSGELATGIVQQDETHLDSILRNEEDFEETGESSNSVPFVRYLDGSGKAKKILARPLDIAPIMQEVLAPAPAICLSATLAMGKNFDHFRRKTGILESSELLVQSPFDYPNQMQLYIADDLPLPNHPQYQHAATARASDLSRSVDGGTFILCTSYDMMQNMKRTFSRHTDRLILVQGTLPKSELLRQFQADGQAVLIATMSFWQGVDVPGSALQLVIIDKIPFASPNDPLVSARIDYIKKQGGSPFRSYQLPQASILLRQGLGRLLRRKSDRGLVAILDARMTKKSYGKSLLKTLPQCPVTSNMEEACEYLEHLPARDA